MAVFALVTSWPMGQDALWLITVLYMPAILGSALTIGPVQSFSLSSLPRAMNPHGVTISSTSFQVAGCVGTALSTGIYGAFVASGSGNSDGAAASRGFLVVGDSVPAFTTPYALLAHNFWTLRQVVTANKDGPPAG